MTANRTFILFLFCSLSACATLDKDECLSADWRQIGQKDGVKGYGQDRYDKHNKACQDYHVQVNIQDYQQGWLQGIAAYCTADNGWKEGVAGETYHKNCPAQLEIAFFNAYQLGRNIYSKEALLNKINTKLDRIADKLEDDDISKTRRKELKSERRNLKSDRFIAKNQLDQAIGEARNMGFYGR